jgi:hypothetical protein
MDPKMDAGMTTTGYKTVEEAIEKGAAPLALTIPQIIDVMDNLLSCEVGSSFFKHLECSSFSIWRAENSVVSSIL